MSTTQVGNTAAQLASKILSTDGAKVVSLTLNDAAIKTLPSGTVEITPTVSGKILLPIWAIAMINSAAGAYTNVHSGGVTNQPFIAITMNGGTAKATLRAYNITAEGYTAFTTFFNAAARKTIFFSLFAQLSGTYGELQGYPQLSTDMIGNLGLTVNNAGDGNFTGGNAANSMVVYVGYVEITAP